MKIVNHLALASFLSVSLASPSFSSSICGPHFNQDIQKIIDKNREQYQLIGVQVSIICPDEQLNTRDFVSGTTTLKGSEPLKPNHLFQIGSETKSFVSALVLQLQAQERLSLDAPISQWIPGLIPEWQAITLKQLLNHTSGIPSYTETESFWQAMENSDFQQAWSSYDLVNLVENSPLDFNPGEGWHYSDSNYVLAGLFISAITGRSVHDELQNRLFTPAHLKHTYYFLSTPPTKILAQMAHGYDLDGQELPKDRTAVNLSFADSAGAIISNAHDTSIWFKQLLTTNKILSAEQRKLMQTVVDTSGGNSESSSGSGLGIFFDRNSQGDEIWSHRGGMPGYRSSMLWMSKQKFAISILINSDNDVASDQLWNDIVNYIHSH